MGHGLKYPWVGLGVAGIVKTRLRFDFGVTVTIELELLLLEQT